MTASAGWSGRNYFSSVVMPDGSIVLMGGNTNSGVANDVWRSTDDGATWTQQTASAGWSARYGQSAVAMPDGSIVLMGGYGYSNGWTALNDVWRSTDDGATWTQQTASAGWSQRYGQSVVAMPDGSIMLMGGYTNYGYYANDVWRSTDDGATWKLITGGAGWSQRYGQSAVAMPDGSIVLMGGQSYGTNFNDVWRFTTAGSNLQNPSHQYTLPGIYPVTLQIYNSSGTNAIQKVGYITVTPEVIVKPLPNFTANPTSGTEPLSVSFTDQSTGSPAGWTWYFGDEDYSTPWTEVNASAGWSARYQQSSVVMPDGSIVLMGGLTNSGYANDVWRSTDDGATWTQMTASAGWSARYGQRAVAMPDGSIVLMGGSTNSGVANDVWRSTDDGATWTRMTASAGWSARYGQRAVAMPDGSIVLMGGSTNSGNANDVWRSTDDGATWTRMTANAPWSARWGQSAVAMPDGSIVLMGGSTNSGYANDVWRSTDDGATWTQQTGSAGWLPRYGHTSVAMPDGSIVLMGGIDPNYSYLNDVWRSTDDGATWTQQTGSAGWLPRYGHTSVAMPDGSIVLMGGSTNSWPYNANDVWRFTTAGSNLQNPSHQYTLPGSYPVTLQVYNSSGTNAIQKTGYITAVAWPKWIPQGGTVFIGETGIDISGRTAGNSTIAWWPAGAAITSTPPTMTLNVGSQVHNFTVAPAEFTGYTGPWYSWNGVTGGSPLLAFQVATPASDIAIRDITTGGTVVTGKTAPIGDELGFEITTNTVNITSERNITGIPFAIILTGPNGQNIQALVNKAGTSSSLTNITVPSSPFDTGGIWNAGNLLYQSGNYTVSAEAMLNGMQAASPNRTVRLSTSAGTTLPVPAITSVSPPASGYVNSTATFTITGKNFESGPGNTTVELRNQTTGLVTTTLTNVTATQITGTADIPANATPGTWNIRVVTADGGETTQPNTFTIANLSRPTITTLTPASGNRNSTVTFTVTGTNFQMGPGKTTVTVSEDAKGTVLPSAITSMTPTQIIGSVTIPVAAMPGAYDLNITTLDGGTGIKTGAFVVGNPAIPTITALTPISGFRNSTVGFTITGTNFEPGNNTIVAFSNQTVPGVILNTTTLTNVTSTTISGTITIPSNAPTGLYRLDVTTFDGGIVNRPNAFTVNAVLAPTVSAITPVSGLRNSTVGFTITGTNFAPGLTTVSFTNQTTGAPINVTILNSVTSTQIIGNITIPANTPTGPCQVNVTTVDGGAAPKPVTFTVTATAAPSISSVTPPTGTKNSVVAFTVTGTNFDPAGTSVNIIDSTSGTILPTSLISVTGTKIIGSVTIPTSVPAGVYSLQVTTVNGGTVNKLQVFTIMSLPLPVMNTLTPATGVLNSTVSFTLVGNYFLNSGTVVLLRSAGTTINATPTLTGVNTTTITGSFAINDTTTTGSYTLYVITNGGGINSKANAFTIAQLATPAVAAVTPVTWYRNATISFHITGTNYEPGLTTVVFMYPGNSTVLNSTVTLTTVTPTIINGTVVVPYNAPGGAWNASVTTLDGGTVWKPNAFTVATFVKPTITAISPTTPWYRNATIPFQIIGTNFEPGLTTVAFAYPLNGTALNSTVVVNTVTATTINGTVVVPFQSPTGSWNVSVTTLDGGTVWKPAAFSVAIFPAPTITSITPVSGFQNATVSFTINGGNFQPGQTTVFLSNPTSGPLATTLYSVTSSQIIGGVQIPATAAIGAWRLNVTTLDGGLTSKTSAFSVSKLPVPSITTFTPSIGYQNTIVSFIITGNYFEPGGLTTVNLTKSGQTDIPTTLTSVYTSSITGTVYIPIGSTTGSWNVNVTTLDGGTATKSNAVSIL
jgi:uncharacterized delta-60 repeat protein